MRKLPVNPAEEMLYEAGIIDKRSAQRQEVIGCIGCRWLKLEHAGKDPRFYGWQIVNCTDLSGSTVYSHLQQLEDGGVIEREPAGSVDYESRGAARTYYRPVDAEVGDAFLLRLRIPDQCMLEVLELDQD